MKNITMSLSKFRVGINETLLKRVQAGEETYTITSHGFPIAQVTAIPPEITYIGDSNWHGPQPPVTPDNRPLLHPVPTPATGEPIQWHAPSTTNTITTSGGAVKIATPGLPSMTDEEQKNIQAELAAEDAADVKAAQAAMDEPGESVSSEQAKKELGLDEDVVPAYPLPGDCTIEQLEKQYGGTAVVKDRAEFLYFISKKRTLTATETEIYRQLMAQLRPPPSDDGT